MTTETDTLREIKDVLESLDCDDYSRSSDVFDTIADILRDAGLPVRTIEDVLDEEEAECFANAVRERDRQHRDEWWTDFRQHAKAKGATDDQVRMHRRRIEAFRVVGAYVDATREMEQFWRSLPSPQGEPVRVNDSQKFGFAK